MALNSQTDKAIQISAALRAENNEPIFNHSSQPVPIPSLLLLVATGYIVWFHLDVKTAVFSLRNMIDKPQSFVVQTHRFSSHPLGFSKN